MTKNFTKLTRKIIPIHLQRVSKLSPADVLSQAGYKRLINERLVDYGEGDKVQHNVHL
ncbi:hypothetical protein SAMN05216516_10553 [Izhakiella capsodis]|uniref:Uncharacterized protein n=1 Tax=Izhakiella capsodis TaxID=1367852 RepID=A0A1I4XWH6_9GAMM|nr:hypothetical protein SAMN05216516_10553 [Izhakiella capsodis]